MTSVGKELSILANIFQVRVIEAITELKTELETRLVL